MPRPTRSSIPDVQYLRRRYPLAIFVHNHFDQSTMFSRSIDWDTVVRADEEMMGWRTLSPGYRTATDQMLREHIRLIPVDMAWMRPVSWVHIAKIHRFQRDLVALNRLRRAFAAARRGH